MVKLISVVVLFFLAIVGGSLLFDFESLLVNSYRQHIQEEARLLGLLLQEPLRRREWKAVEHILLEHARNQPELVHLRATTPGSDLQLYHSRPEPARGEVQISRQELHDQGERLLSVELHHDSYPVRWGVWNHTLKVALLLVTLLFWLLLHLLMRRTLVLPLEKELASHKETRLQLEEALQALQEERDYLRTVLTTSLDAIFILNDQGEVVDLNPAAEALFGYARGALLRRELIACVVPPAVQEPYRNTLTRLMAACLEQPVRHPPLRVTGLRADGSRLVLEFSLAASSARQKTLFTAFLHDRTAHLQALQALRETLAVAESANQAKSAFLANMSHEIRSPLNAIIGMTDLVLRTSMSAEEVRNHIQVVHHSSESLLEILNNILDVSKIDAGQLQLESVEFEPRILVEEVCEWMSIKAHQKDLELNHYVPATLPHTLVGDPLRLRQILLNLVGNAVKFTESGEVMLRVEPLAADSAASDSLVEVAWVVADTGIGIAPEGLKHIFEQFNQLDNSITRKYGGTGLGLTICQKLVEMMGGTIHVESVPERGTLFRVVLALARGATPAAPPPLEGVRIVLIDDHASGRLSLTTILKGWGAQVTAWVGFDPQSPAGLEQQADLLLMDYHTLKNTLQVAAVTEPPDAWCHKSIVLVPALDSIGCDATDGWLAACVRVQKPVCRCRLLRAMEALLGRESAPERVVCPGTPLPDPGALSRQILLVEDLINNQLLARMILEKAGHRVTLAVDGLQALELLAKQRFDLVLMDVQMPEMDGFEATRRIRAGSGLDSQVPIVAVTAWTTKEEEQLCLDVGMNGLLCKPYTVQAMLAVVARFARSPTPSAPWTPPPTACPPDPDLQQAQRARMAAEWPQRAGRLATALERRQALTLVRELNDLKQSASTLGLHKLSARLLQYRGHAEMGDWEEAHALHQEVERLMETLIGPWNEQPEGKIS
ncbi:MAG: response regulator [Magnetococcales bacterium]|nr:response regulator [Magnetococcales bacterium]